MQIIPAFMARVISAGIDWAAGPLPPGASSGTTGWVTHSSDEAGMFLYAAGGGYYSRSTDYADNFTALTRGLGGNTTTSYVRFTSIGGGIWFAFETTGITRRSTDNGTTWSEITRGLGSGSNAAPTIFVHNGSGVILAKFSSSLRRSTDYGATWTQTWSPGVSAANVRSVASVTGAWIASTTTAVFRVTSSDGSGSWTALPAADIGSTGRVSTLHTDGASMIIAAPTGANTIPYRTNDAGLTWAELPVSLNNPGVGTTYPSFVRVSASVIISFAVGYGTGVFYGSITTDNGATWTGFTSTISTSVTGIKSLAANDAGALLLLANNGLAFVSGDLAANWLELPYGLGTGVPAGTGSGPNALAVSGGDGVWLAAWDGGYVSRVTSA